ncbi:hypothetical protein R6242_22045 [Iodobacter sp. CM08]|uniref:hypothetical protein n=1 Tax=Iodobacter sp. CM08 TaxID=3085902 RepID=UPI002980E6A4|nr:hypothetical protein [Iodobacter sp. CM08]MDW5419258.1 hypothetical protein [Iodobacter sp. CM08]
MSEFNNRITAQRDALAIVNSADIYREPLLSLTEKAINRWVSTNGIIVTESIVLLLKSMSGTLFFLANKSQEQISEDYEVLSKKVDEQLFTLKLEVANKALQRTRVMLPQNNHKQITGVRVKLNPLASALKV